MRTMDKSTARRNAKLTAILLVIFALMLIASMILTRAVVLGR